MEMGRSFVQDGVIYWEYMKMQRVYEVTSIEQNDHCLGGIGNGNGVSAGSG